MKFDPSIVQTRIQTPLGEMCLGATAKGLAGAWFIDQRHRPDGMDFKSLPHAWPTQDAHPTLVQARREMQEYFDGKRQVFDVDLDINGGTLFQQSVWRALLKIAHGKTSTYGDIGRQINKPAAVRAVGSAVGRNPLSVIIPCHRVLGGDGSLTGYAGGLHRKTALLGLEGIRFEGHAATSKSAFAKSASTKSALTHNPTPSLF